MADRINLVSVKRQGRPYGWIELTPDGSSIDYTYDTPDGQLATIVRQTRDDERLGEPGAYAYLAEHGWSNGYQMLVNGQLADAGAVMAAGATLARTFG